MIDGGVSPLAGGGGWWGLTTGRGEGGGDSMMKLFSTRILSKYFTGFKKTLV